LAGKGKQRIPLLQRRNWFVSAGLVFLLYFVLLYALSWFSEDTSLLVKMCHALPLIAILMVVLGLFEKSKEEERERDRAKNRYDARLEITKAKREIEALGKAKEAATKKSGGDANESK